MADPADQRTADRETIAQALFRAQTNGPDDEKVTAWEASPPLRDYWLGIADAVLAVLVHPNVYRAEGVEAAADKIKADRQPEVSETETAALAALREALITIEGASPTHEIAAQVASSQLRKALGLAQR